MEYGKEEINLYTYLRILHSNLKVILITFALFLVLSSVIVATQPKRYVVSMIMGFEEALVTPTKIMDMINEGAFNQTILKAIGLDPAGYSPRINAYVLSNSPMVKVTIKTEEPSLNNDIAFLNELFNNIHKLNQKAIDLNKIDLNKQKEMAQGKLLAERADNIKKMELEKMILVKEVYGYELALKDLLKTLLYANPIENDNILGKEYLLNSIAVTKNNISKANLEIELKNLLLKQEREKLDTARENYYDLDGIKIVQEPQVLPKKNKSKIIIAVMSAIGLMVGICLAFILEFIKNEGIKR
ncbi:MAG: hypothetical protein PHV60_00370 [bacterium]|nr:hypothetical protein [bacterium]